MSALQLWRDAVLAGGLRARLRGDPWRARTLSRSECVANAAAWKAAREETVVTSSDEATIDIEELSCAQRIEQLMRQRIAHYVGSTE